MRKLLLILYLFPALGVPAKDIWSPKYFPIGTKWTELRLDTTKYDSWYSKSGDEWIPNFERIDYCVKEQFEHRLDIADIPYSVFSHREGKEDSLRYIVSEYQYYGENENVNYDGVRASIPYDNHYKMLSPQLLYQFGNWTIGKSLLARRLYSSIASEKYTGFGSITEIGEEDFGGVRKQRYCITDKGYKLIDGIGITAWSGRDCIFGPCEIDEALVALGLLTHDYLPTHYCTILARFERDGEVLYDVWPEKEGSDTPQTDIAINEENFPDPNFRAWLLKQRYGQDGVLTEEEIGRIEEIYIFQQGIQSLEGIKYFTALRSLDIVKNELAELDLSGLTELRTLGLQENQLNKLEISDCTELLSLHCSHNNLKELDLSGLTKLEDLICNNNLLTELDLSPFMVLRHVYCERNRLCKLILPPTELLTRVMCGDNQLTKIDISGLKRLEWLYCYGNQIDSEAMGDIIENLPVAYGDAFFYVIRGDIPDGNVCTKEQVEAARAKGWVPRTYSNGGGSNEYEGSDPETVSDIKAQELGGPWYDLSGRLQNRSPRQRGIYVKDGRKRILR